jgi:hypothetical protein
MLKYGPEQFRTEEFRNRLTETRKQQRKTDIGLADEFRGLKLGYKEAMGSEQLKEAYNQKGLTDPSFYADVAEFGLEQGVKSTPDMVAIMYALPAYAASKIEEMASESARNDDREDPTIVDAFKVAPFALASIVFDKIGIKYMTKAFKTKAGKEMLKAGFFNAAKRIAASTGKGVAGESVTEFVQEGVIEYIGKKWGTKAKMDVFEAL